MIIILQLFHVRFEECILNPYLHTFNLDNKLLIKQKLLIRKYNYILFHDEKIFIRVIRHLYNFTNLIP